LPSLTASYAGFVNGDSSSSLTAKPTITTTATISNHVVGSPYPITASGAFDADYTISYSPGGLTVTPVALTITPDNKSRLFGLPNPALTVSYSGFVLSDTSASLSTQPIVVTTATVGSPVGGYPITASGAADTDYSIGYLPGTLTIGQAASTTMLSPITAIALSSNVTFTATVTDSTPGSTGTPTGIVTFKDGNATIGTGTLVAGVATFSTSSLSLGSHPISAVYSGDLNFTGSASSALTETVLPFVVISWEAPLAGQPVANKIKVGQVVPHKVDLVNSLGQTVTTGVTVKLDVQGIQMTSYGTNCVFQDVVEDASGIGADGTAAGCGTMYLVSSHFQFNLDTSDFSDSNTLAESNRYYTSTVLVLDNATGTLLGSTAIKLETGSN
jgi:hypothetical protein